MTKLVTVTGAGGYIGSVLVGRLLDAGYGIRAIDRFFFGGTTLSAYSDHPRLHVVRRDIRDLTALDLEGSWAVIDLAALSNDPSGELDPVLTDDINRRGRTGVARAARSAGVGRYVFSSSCSIYGTGNDVELTENSPIKPLTTYARSCALAEDAILAMNGQGFTTVALRNATVFGVSPRMRFDLVVNLMTVNAYEKRRIKILGGGHQWRPLVHVRDVAAAMQTALEAPTGVCAGEAFNIGFGNYQVHQIASIVAATLPFRTRTIIARGNADRRDYNVSFNRAAEVLAFKAGRGVEQGVLEIYEALVKKNVAHDEQTETVAWYSYLLRAKRILQEVELNSRLL